MIPSHSHSLTSFETFFEASFGWDQNSVSNVYVADIPSQDKVNQQILGFNNETQGWFPCKIVEVVP